MQNSNTPSSKLRSRNWIITHHIDPETGLDGQQWLKDLYEKTKARYVVGQVERAPTTYSKHIQAYVNYSDAKAVTALHRYSSKTHWEVCRNAADSERYCLKEDTRVEGPWTFGEYPLRRNSKTDWDQIYALAKKRNFEEIPKDVLVVHYNSISKIAKDNTVAKECTHLRGIYIYGKSGIGKSLLARSLFPTYSVFAKAPNKWFDSYDGEQVIIWDDINPDLGSKYCTNLKLFTDRYGVKVETKGSTLGLQHEYFIITSQYTFEEVFRDPEDYAAMKRRCFVFHMFHDEKLNVISRFSIRDMHAYLSNNVKPDIEKYIIRDGEDEIK